MITEFSLMFSFAVVLVLLADYNRAIPIKNIYL